MIGLIIAAGKQKRFNSNIPKALVEYEGEILVNRNINILNNYCDKTYVVVSNNNYSLFKEYIDEDNLLNIGESGKGSGDAIYEALKQLKLIDEDILICWGDTILNSELFKNIPENRDKYKVYIPATIEDSPYVQLKDNKVLFKKYNDNITRGYHDSSIFIGNASIIYIYCIIFRVKYLNSNLEYNHKHGNEFEFLDIFNDTTLDYQVVEIEKEDDNLSFNTLEELENIKERG